ncbi:V-type ATP synthase subunit E family protein [Streptomyces goshikiensis]|uniref:hypothetical protein n=1 Tax=Streptomyces goshikiensis TaxID=1942 RepID=UPI002AE031E6|nr:hypothetical protein [Streptomyces goshikiensis]
MTNDDPEIERADAVMAAFEDALSEFVEQLELFYIAHGIPSYAVLARLSGKPRLTPAGLTEMLRGRRLPSLEVLLEFVRVATMPKDLAPAVAAKFRADPAVADEWRARWQEVKRLQRKTVAPNARVRATVRQTLDAAAAEAEAVREDARAQATHIRTAAEAEAADIYARARHEADALLQRARQAAQEEYGSPKPGLGLRLLAPAGSGGAWRRRSAVLTPRRVLRPMAGAAGVAGLALAVMLAGDAGLGASGTCVPDRTQAADSLAPRAGLHDQAMQQAAFAIKPESYIPGAILPCIVIKSQLVCSSSSTPAADPAPQASATPTPITTPTPQTSPTPQSSPTPRTSPAPGKPDACAHSS